jgi:hypothetical protein
LFATVEIHHLDDVSLKALKKKQLMIMKSENAIRLIEFGKLTTVLRIDKAVESGK